MNEQKQSTTNNDTIITLKVSEFDEVVETVLSNLADDVLDFGIDPTTALAIGVLSSMEFSELRRILFGSVRSEKDLEKGN